MSPFLMVYGKQCHLPIELEHKAFWEIKQFNLALDEAGQQRKLQINELEEIWNDVTIIHGFTRRKQMHFMTR